MSKISSIIDMTKIKIKANKSNICFGLGIVFGGLAIASAAYAGTKTPSILEQRRKELDEIEEARNDENRTYEYTEEDAEKDIKRANGRCIVEFTKVYGPVIGFSAAALACAFEGKKTDSNHISYLSTALNGLQASYAGYRERVATYVGREKEEQIFRGLRKKQDINPETGELHETEYVDPIAEEQSSLFDRVFDDSSKLWQDEAWTNQNFLYEIQAYLNHKLQERALYSGVGVLTFNEALKSVGLPECPEGFVLGWWYSDDHRTEINLGFDKDARFINGLSKDVHLRFNVEGDILKPLREKNIKKIYSF